MAQPGERPLNFVGSIPPNGATNVSRTNTITLKFDKNVVDDSVWQNNRQQILLYKGSTRVDKAGNYTVTRKTATSLRRNIYLKLLKALAPNTKYKIAIYPDLTSKAGETLGKTVILTFTTGSGGTVIPTPEE